MTADTNTQFREAIARADLAPPDHLVAGDGNLYRFATNGKRGDDSGWYVFHSDGIPAGAFGCWRTGMSETWRADVGRELTPKEEREHRERIARARAARERADVKRQEDAAVRAGGRLAHAKPAPADHAYLTTKGVPPHELRVHQGLLTIRGIDCDGALVMPLRDSGGVLHSVEFITADGEKRYLPGGRVTGCSALLASPTACCASLKASQRQRACTRRPATRVHARPVRAISGRSPEARRAAIPQLRIVIAADRDASGTGERAAAEAARAVDGVVAMPSQVGTDWNDVFLSQGANAVRAGIEAFNDELSNGAALL